MFTGVSMHACLLVRSLAHSLVGCFILSMHASIYRAVCVYNPCHTTMPFYMWMAINDVKLSSIVKSEVEDGLARCGQVREESANEQEPVNMCILYAWCVVHLCVLYMLWLYSYISLRKKAKKMKLFPIFVPLLTLLAVLFFLVNTILTHQLFTWVASSDFLSGWHSFPPSETETKSPRGRVTAIENEWW